MIHFLDIQNSATSSMAMIYYNKRGKAKSGKKSWDKVQRKRVTNFQESSLKGTQRMGLISSTNFDMCEELSNMEAH